MGNPEQEAAQVEELRKIPVFRSLPAQVLEKLAAISHREIHPTDEVLFEEGSDGDSLYLVLDGRAIIQKVIDREAGTTKDLAVLEAGDMLGEMALFDNKPRSATVRVADDLIVLRIYASEFGAFLHRDAASAAVILGGVVGILSARLREQGQHVATLYETGNLIARVRDPEELARGVMEQLLSAMPHVVASSFSVWTPYQDAAELAYASGLAEEGEEVLALARPGPVYNYLQENPTPFVLSHLEGEHPLRRAFAYREGDQVLVAPMVHHRDVLGLMLLMARGVAFTSFHRILVSAVASQVGSALVNLTYAKEAEARSRLETARSGLLGSKGRGTIR